MQFAAVDSATLKGLARSDAGSGNSLLLMVQMLAMGIGATIGVGLVGVLSGELASTQVAFRWTFAVVGLATLAFGIEFKWLDEPGVRNDAVATIQG